MLTASTAQAVAFPQETRPFRADSPAFDKPAEGRAETARPRPVDMTKKAAVTRLGPSAWPKAGSATIDVTPTGKAARPGGLPVTLSAPTAKTARSSAARHVRVEVMDQRRAAALGAAALIKARHTDAGRKAGKIRLTLGYKAFKDAYGGDYGARLGLFQLPACAISAVPGSKACPLAPIRLKSVNDTEAGTLSADVQVGPESPTAPMLAVAAEATSSQGNYNATPLSPSASWSVAPSTGGFSWSYPMRVVPTPGGQIPSVGLSYSSQAADGKTGTTNNQGSWVGESFSYEPGYIERQYKPCADDGHKSSGELCWAHDNATIMLNGSSGQLIKDDKTGAWHMTGGAGWKIEKLTGASNGDNNGEHWKVIADGSEYHFGLNRRPGWRSDNPATTGKVDADPVTDSTWNVPVTGDDSGEPCYKAAFADAWCMQAWRWNLDYVKDRHGNTMSYVYGKELNAYARGGKTDVAGTTYSRGGYLKRIEYGQRDTTVFTEAAPARVVFTTAERCVKDAAFDCDPAKWTEANVARWPDTPYDRYCAVGTKCKFTQATPSFFTRKKLTSIATQMRTGPTTTTTTSASTPYATVDAWNLKHIFTDNGDDSRTLWLSEIEHEGKGNGGSVKLPSVQLLGRKLPNRVDEVGNNLSPINRFRLYTVLSESGSQLDVTYKPADCAVGTLPKPGESVRRCYPVVWAPPGYLEPITDWFHKYVVASVQQSDRTGKSAPMVTDYEYLGDAAWRKTQPDGITDPKFLTWSQWQGYGKVRVTAGDGQNQTSRVDYTYLQGMDGDADPGGGKRAVSVTDSAGVAHKDLEEYVGFELEKAVYSGGALVSKVISQPWQHTTATQTRTWDGTQVVSKATTVRPEVTRGFTALAGGGWRESKSVTTYDTGVGVAGRVEQVDNLGDLSTSADDTCTRTTYADNLALNLVNLPRQIETVAVNCHAVPKRATQVLSDQRTSYDNGALGAAPTRGLATRTERLTKHDGTTPTYRVTGTTTYDGYGRPLTQTDERAKATTTFDYTEANGLISQVTSKNQLGHLTTTEYAPAWGQAKAQIDPNGKRTDLEFDDLGRLTSVWLPDRTKGAVGPSLKYGYLIRQDDASVIKTEKVDNDGTYGVEYQLFDSLLRPRQQQTEGPDGSRMVADTWYDGLGKIAKTNATYNATGLPSDKLMAVTDGDVGAQTRYSYDGLGRPTAEIFAIAGHEQWRTTTSYDATSEGDRVHTDPPQGGTPTTAVSNAKGQLTELRHFDGSSPDLTAPYSGHTATKYTYWPSGQMKSVTDAVGNVWSYDYDQLGRKTKTVDPDAGTSTTTYDDADRPVTTTDGRGQSVTTAYDVLGRPTLTYAGKTVGGTKLTETRYDKAGALGHPYASFRYTDGTQYFASVTARFDTFYRPTQSSISVPASEGTTLKGVYTYTTAYNADGTVASTGMPGVGGLPAETLATTYDKLQRPLTLKSATTNYVTDTVWTPTSQLSTLTLDTGGKQTQQSYFYERGTDRLTRHLVTVDGLSKAAKDTRTSYDPAGNVLSIADTSDTTAPAKTDVQCFAYDAQKRLSEAWTSSATATSAAGGGTIGMLTPEYSGKTPSACAAAPGASPLGGPAPYWTSYTIDKIGNRTKEVRHDTGLNAAKNVTRTYTYADADQDGTPHEPATATSDGDGGPHAVTKVTEQTPTGTQTAKYAYDKAGNTKQRTPVGGDSQFLEWDAEGKVTKISEPDDPTTPGTNEATETTFLYDASGNRLKRKDASGTTIYLPGTELHLPSGATVARATRYYTHADQIVAVRTSDNKVSFIAADHHGTGDLAIDATTGAVTQRRLDPYGNQRTGNTGNWPGQKGFVGGTIDESTGLTNIGARQYDSYLGKFISVDPLIDVTSPQQMNAYAYANNTPVTLSDPTGLKPDDCAQPGASCNLGRDGQWNVSATGDSGTTAETKVVEEAEANHNRAKQKVVDAGKALAKILMDELGVTAALDCISSGDAAACGETLLNIAGSFAGGLAGKLLAKYGAPWKWDDAARLVKRVGGLLGDLVSGIKEIWDTSKALGKARDKLAAAQAKFKKSQEPSCRVGGKAHSFLPGTQVLLADGSTKPIEDVEPGDKIVTTDPGTGEEVVREVVGTIVTEDDKHFVDLTIVADGKPASLISTTTHPFWVEAEKSWVEAGDLRPGMRLTTPAGDSAVVEATRYFEKRQRTHDLTIADLHAYYVLAGATPVLVHNCNVDPQSAPGGKNGAAVSIKQVKMALGRAGMSVSRYDIVHVPEIRTAGDGLPAYGNSPHDGNGMPNLGPRGRPVIQISNMGLADMDTAVATIFHEIHHHRMYATWPGSMGGTESAAEEFGQAMLGVFRRRTGS
ncbi:polymorphic toxin-type HINT domain-containing protein [Streptomyces purpureus]|uniref:polymorphic toxin-type HINT domain-containing protein n=1 Tax=Streptomyces purpureus TaxID=1951 RepID=UPI001FD3B5C4|nr:polymorphic toxin-type HINT domain-containing protein [Streptomyces purpureus]